MSAALMTTETARAQFIERGITRGRFRYNEDGELEKRCSRCRDYWPADLEFFFKSSHPDGLHTYCKACYYEQRWPNGQRPTQALTSQAPA